MKMQFVPLCVLTILLVICAFLGCSTLEPAKTTISVPSVSVSFSPSVTTRAPSSTSTGNELGVTAEIITQSYVYRMSPPDRVQAILYFNQTDDYISVTCKVRQRDANGGFISDYVADSGMIPPHSHYVRYLEPDIKGTLTIIDLQKYVDLPNPQRWANITISNILVQSGNILTGELNNIGSITPKVINLHILKLGTDNKLSLVADSYPSSESRGFDRSPMPPPGEKINFYIRLLQDISIIDSKNGLINGEINIIAQK